MTPKTDVLVKEFTKKRGPRRHSIVKVTTKRHSKSEAVQMQISLHQSNMSEENQKIRRLVVTLTMSDFDRTLFMIVSLIGFPPVSVSNFVLFLFKSQYPKESRNNSGRFR
jgi:hypothetical protein